MDFTLKHFHFLSFATFPEIILIRKVQDFGCCVSPLQRTQVMRTVAGMYSVNLNAIAMQNALNLKNLGVWKKKKVNTAQYYCGHLTLTTSPPSTFIRCRRFCCKRLVLERHLSRPSRSTGKNTHAEILFGLLLLCFTMHFVFLFAMNIYSNPSIGRSIYIVTTAIFYMAFFALFFSIEVWLLFFNLVFDL